MTMTIPRTLRMKRVLYNRWWEVRGCAPLVVCASGLAKYYRIPSNATRLKVTFSCDHVPNSVEIYREESRFCDIRFDGAQRILTADVLLWFRQHMALGDTMYAVVEHNGNRRWLLRRYSTAIKWKDRSKL